MEIYRFEKEIGASAPVGMDFAVLEELWNGFCFRLGHLKLHGGAQNRIGFGNAVYLPPADDEEYTVCIRPEGIGLQARNEASLARAFGALLCRIDLCVGEKDTFFVSCGEIHGRYSITRRMIHLCVFPETDFSMLRRLVRLCGVLSYTHVVLEFWGMVRYDCLHELAWPQAFSKEQISVVIREARALGMEPIPMINHLGHAASCRIDSGKHVVLDQNPTLQYLFTPDGWCWNIFSKDVPALLRKMRQELYDLFGDGAYFHIGCDEALIFSSEYYPAEGLCRYLRTLTDEVVSEGRRPILWGDMILPQDCNSEQPQKAAAAWKQAEQTRKLMNAVNSRSVIADWHYDVTRVPVPTVVEFQKSGFDVLGCPFDQTANIDAQYATATGNATYGLMMTTWHTLYANISTILYCARKCGFPKVDWTDHAGHRNLEIAALLRRVSPTALPYAECGFVHRQIKEVPDW